MFASGICTGFAITVCYHLPSRHGAGTVSLMHVHDRQGAYLLVGFVAIGTMNLVPYHIYKSRQNWIGIASVRDAGRLCSRPSSSISIRSWRRRGLSGCLVLMSSMVQESESFVVCIECQQQILMHIAPLDDTTHADRRELPEMIHTC